MADSFAGSDVARIAFDGANNAVAASDSLGHPLVFNGTAKLSTANFKHGASSVAFDGTNGQGVTSANSNDWNMGAGDFCVDYWVRCTLGGTHVYLGDGTNYAFYISAVGNSLAAYFNNMAQSIVHTGAPWVDSTSGRWVHIALTRSGNVFRLFADGRILTTATLAFTLDFNASMVLTLGCRGVGAAATNITGNIDSFRMTKGAARYTASNLPPVDENFNSYDASFVQTTSLGTYTRQVSAYGASNPDAIIRAVSDAIVSLGWELFDVVYWPTVYTVFRCLNKDGLTYKYTALLWDKSRFKVTQVSMEAWDTTTRTMTNECWSNNRTDGVHGFNVSNCDIVIYGSTRHLGMMTYLQASNSIWSMCFETERDAAEDTAAAALPCWGMTYGHKFLMYSGGTSRLDFVVMPRTKDGHTGNLAANYWTQLTSVGAWGRLGVANSRFGLFFQSSETTWRSGTYGWDSAKKLITHVKPVRDNAVTDAMVTPYGRIFALKAVPPCGQIMDKVAVPVDSDFWFSAGGTDADHWLLPSHLANTALFAGAGATTPTVSSWAVGQVVNSVVYTGDSLYLGTNAGVYKINVTTGAVSLVAGTSGITFDVVFDGRFVYAAYVSGVHRIDTKTNDAVLSVTVGTGGTRGLVHNGRGYLFATDRTAATVIRVHKIETPSMTVVGVASMPARVTASIAPALAVDDKGASVGLTTGNMTTAADMAFGMVNQSAMSGAWTYTVARLCDSFGCSWRGQHFNTAWKISGASGPYLTFYFLDGVTGTGAAGQMEQALAADTFGSGKCTQESINCVSLCCISGATAAVTSLLTTGALPDVGAGSGSATSLGPTSLLNQPSRTMAWTGNNVFVAGQDNVVYHASMLNKGAYSGSNYAHTLVPR